MSLTTSILPCGWSATSNNPAWLHVTSSSGGVSSATISYSVDPNTGPARSGTITIADKTFTINQSNGCTYSISPSSQFFAAAGGSGSVSVTTNSGCAWSVSTTTPWIDITSGSNIGNGNVFYTVAANSGAARSGTVTIAGQTFTVSQAAAGCTYSISPTSKSFPTAGGSGSVSVTTTSSCGWTAITTAPWITVTASGGSGSGTASYTVAANTGISRSAKITVAGQNFLVIQAGVLHAKKSNFDGDDRTDMSFWRSGVWYIMSSLEGSAQNITLGLSSDLKTPGDYDGDGKTDAAIYNPTSGSFSWIESSTGTTITDNFSTAFSIGTDASDVPVQADYDNDGKTDPALWRGSTGTWYIHLSSTNSLFTRNWGTSSSPYNDIPVQSDYDGDGKADLAVWRPATGSWYIVKSTTGFDTTQPLSINWGAGASPYFDIPVPADYDGDGKADLGVWRPGDGYWYILKSSLNYDPTQYIATAWGAGSAPYGDIPVPGDYDGDGKADLAVWRPLDGYWYVIRSSDGVWMFVNHGQSGDLPIPSKER